MTLQITPLPTPPSRQDPTNFSTSADAFLGALPAFATETNALAIEVTTNATDAAASATAAANQAESAATSAAAATGAANYKGEYNPVITYQVGHSCSYNDLIFTAKTVNTGVTPVSGANWLVYLHQVYQNFTTSGTWTKPAGCKFVYVENIGGGASGVKTGDSCGGGGGGFNASLFFASDLPDTVTVTVGAGGARSTSATRNAGGNTSFGSYLVAKGGAASHFDRSLAGGGESSAEVKAKGNGGYSSGAGGYQSEGGDCTKGGAGGGGIYLATSAGYGGGTSQDGGKGGDASFSGLGSDGAEPGGGGGSTNSGASAGGGANGRIRVWAW